MSHLEPLSAALCGLQGTCWRSCGEQLLEEERLPRHLQVLSLEGIRQHSEPVQLELVPCLPSRRAPLGSQVDDLVGGWEP